MNKKNLWMICVITLAVLVLCCGCSSIVQSLENAQIRKSTETMLNALIEDDFQTAYQLVSTVCTEQEFEEAFVQMQDFLGEDKSYTLKFLSIHASTNISNGQQSSVISSVYEMTTESNRIIVSIQTDGQYNLKSFHLTPYENTDYYVTGTLENMKDTSAAQWIVLLINVLVLGLTAFALVDCCRQTIKKKALWIILLVLGFVSVGLTVSATGFRVNFNVGWILAYSALIRYGSGTIVFRLLMPVGTVLYFINRPGLLKQGTPVTVSCEQSPTVAEETAVPQTSTNEQP